YQIRVNAICPGYFRTDISDEFLGSDFGKAMIKRVPQRRLGELNDLTGPLLLLASEAGAHMTGTTLVVDGGHSISSL
ncbi:MAG: SDR family oxidoreductase, partial [Acetobacteraceae bacterium]|nr:SDR family oxidoreductase [Acetobacteraceae bacterium]